MKITGLEQIPKARWKLVRLIQFDFCCFKHLQKCQFCNHTDGACIQCASAKCVRAFHPQCAIKQKLYMQSRPMHLDDATRTLFECFCQGHDPRGKQQMMKKKTKTELHEIEIALALDLKTEYFLAKWADGNYYRGSVDRDIRERSMCIMKFDYDYVKLVDYSSMKQMKEQKILEKLKANQLAVQTVFG